MTKTKVQNVVLLMGKIESFGDIRELPSHGNEVIMGALIGVQLDIVEYLIGELGASHPNFELPMTSRPKSGSPKHVYVFGRTLPDGSFQALRWDYTVEGLCIPLSIAKTYAVEDDLTQLRRTRRINWNSECDW